MPVQAREIQYGAFGRALKIENGFAEICVTLDFGPRIIRYALSEGENFMFEDGGGQIVEKGPAFDALFGEGAYWRTYGGHRLWLTPESKPGTYNPDNDPVEYSREGDCFTFTPPPQDALGVQERLCVAMDGTGTDVTVTGFAKNTADIPQTFGIWHVSVMCKGGLAAVPQTLSDTGLLHNRRMSLWPYTDMGDERVKWGRSLITLEQDPDAASPFKIGTSNSRGFAAYFAHGAMFVKRFPFYEDCAYPDDGCNFEIYTNRHFLELESLGRLAPVDPGDEITAAERWSIVPGLPKPISHGRIEEIIAGYIEK